MAKHIQVNVPVLTGNDYKHVIARGDISIEGDDVVITISAKGRVGLELSEALTSGEIVALSFSAVPAQPHTSKENK